MKPKLLPPFRVLPGDKVFSRPSRKKAPWEFVGIATSIEYCNPTIGLWKIYLRDGPIGRLFVFINEKIKVLRK